MLLTGWISGYIEEIRNLHWQEIDPQPCITTRLGLTSELSPGCVRIALLGCSAIVLSGCSAIVMMVQTTDFPNLGHLAFSGSLYSPGVRGILGER
jgi:hypothetical protein